MCAIVDTNVAGEIFGSNRNSASQRFFEWLSGGQGRLVIGGALKTELRHRRLEEWLNEAIQAGRVFEQPEDRVEAATRTLQRGGLCRSDDPHVIALAQVSGARLLYSNDYALQKDFTDVAILSGRDRGRVYTTVTGRRQPVAQQGGRLRPVHRQLLARRDLCRRTGD